MSGNSKRSAIKPEKPAIRVARKRGQICEAGCNREIPNWFYRVGKLVYGSLAQNPRGEDSSPEDYWTVGAIRGHSFYKVLSSKAPVASILNLNDVKSLQDLALAQDMTRGVILDSIFKQVDRLGNISVAVLQHYVTTNGKVKWDDKVSDKDKAEAVSPLLPLKRIMYKDNDDGMNWGRDSISVTPILNETHHIDQTIYTGCNGWQG
jgi:hypothetical protein